MDPSLPRPLSSQQLIEEEYNIHGVGRPLRLLKQNPNFDGVDPYFWEHGIAGGTAFMVWEASWTLIELLKLPPWREAVHGATVVELGSGCGLVGLVAASLGGNVLLTDLPSIVNSILTRNLHLNVNSDILNTTTPIGVHQSGHTDTSNATSMPAQAVNTCMHEVWASSVAVGLGSAAVVEVDWETDTASQLMQASPPILIQTLTLPAAASPEVPLQPNCASQRQQQSHQDSVESAAPPSQLPQADPQSAHDPSGKKVDLILAVDTVWLRSLLPCFTHTVASILRMQPPGQCQCLLAFADRVLQGVGEEPVHNEGGRFFSTRQDVFAAFQAESCSVEVISEGHLTQDVDKLPVVVARIWMDQAKITCPCR